jgi:methylenetetrahydrofolate reductase (NADPH)
VIAHVGPEITLTATSSPTRGIEATVALSEWLAAHGYRVVPHLAARLVFDRAHLRELLARLGGTWACARCSSSPGNIGPPAGEFDGDAPLLAVIAEVGHGLEEIGITG